MGYLPKHLFAAILLGAASGFFARHAAVALRPLGDGFLSLIKNPLYFERVSTFTLALGLGEDAAPHW